MADRLGPDADLAIGGDGHRQRVGAVRADVAHQHRGAAVDEALGQPFVERVGQAALDRARALGPFGGVGEPVGALGDIGPAADPGEAVGERLDIAGDIVEPRDFGGEPFVRDVPALADVAEQAADHARMVHRPDLAEIGQPAHRPQFARLAPAQRGDRGVLGDQLEHGEVDRQRGGAQQRIVRAGLEAGDEVGGGREIEVGAAPVEVVERAEAMLLDRVDFLLAELGRAVAAEAQGAEAAVALVAPGAAGDLRHFGDRQAAVAAAVELVQPGEGDVGHVHVEAHADGVGGDEIIDLAALEHRDLGVARGRAERAHHHRGAALEAAQHLGQRVDLLARESDDRAARGQARRAWPRPSSAGSRSAGG